MGIAIVISNQSTTHRKTVWHFPSFLFLSVDFEDTGVLADLILNDSETTAQIRAILSCLASTLSISDCCLYH